MYEAKHRKKVRGKTEKHVWGKKEKKITFDYKTMMVILGIYQTLNDC